MTEFHFTFVRGAPQREENRDTYEADSLEEAAAEAERFCQRHACQIVDVEWFDEEDKRWRKSSVQYT